MFVQNEYHNEKMQNDKGYLEESIIYYTFVGFTNLRMYLIHVFNPFFFVIFEEEWGLKYFDDEEENCF